MSRDRDPFERALEALRAKLRAGEGLQGRPLAINLLAREIGVSQTPVREALAWLAGEGLIVRVQAGYAGRTFEASTLAELYKLNLAYIVTALAGEISGSIAPVGWPPAKVDTPEAAFLDLVARTGDRTLLIALRRIRESLSPFAAAEAEVLADLDNGLQALHGAVGSLAELRAVAKAYYRRRVRAAPAILAMTLSHLGI